MENVDGNCEKDVVSISVEEVFSNVSTQYMLCHEITCRLRDRVLNFMCIDNEPVSDLRNTWSGG